MDDTHTHTPTPCTYWTRNGIRVYSVPGFLLRRQLIELLFSVLIIKAAGEYREGDKRTRSRCYFSQP